MSEVTLKVAMACEGCVGAVKRVAEKLPGVTAVDIDLAAQKVTVKGAGLDAAAVKEGVAKSGKKTELWQ
ncbi:copper transport ATX1-like [Micractinium conductrix]|uniref:Copper transport ATX1-like n=1 Tax=Micractinium conductrix TaxID=554055 RepID=A0A2P6UZ02_9CHLO|nr:copper transport ATX1-like [Micractinium conductrix]PSC67510.1 copper transport ATX1-like [Micractinium conductrix]PSC67817.1 copper transport ATX1-like [Micractinium conductrix]|eukprot:PSC67068.1 copper transport ATX1-like [Micractinium conductrix]